MTILIIIIIIIIENNIEVTISMLFIRLNNIDFFFLCFFDVDDQWYTYEQIQMMVSCVSDFFHIFYLLLLLFGYA